jgi:hypothetical protein
MERRELERSAARVVYLRGLLAVPFGLVLLASAAGNLEWGPYRNGAVFVATVVVLGALGWAIYRWYEEHYGRVRLTSAQQVRLTAASFTCFGIGLSSGAFLDSKLDLSVCPSIVLFGVAMLVWFAICTGLRPDNAAVWVVLIAVGLLPVWDVADPTSVAWVPIAVAVIVAGVLDHLALVRRFGPAGAHVGA